MLVNQSKDELENFIKVINGTQTHATLHSGDTLSLEPPQELPPRYSNCKVYKEIENSYLKADHEPFGARYITCGIIHCSHAFDK